NSFFQHQAQFPSAADFRFALACWDSIAQPLPHTPDLRVSGDGRHQILWDNCGAQPSGAGSGFFHITPNAWTDFDSGPGIFHRPDSADHFPNLNSDPHPVFHSLLPLRRLLRPATAADWHRIVIWLLAALRPDTACPILVLQGPAHSGKSTAARLLRRTLDPAVTPFVPLPATESQLHRAAFNNYVLPFDHVTRMPGRLAGMLTQISTGVAAQIDGFTHELKRAVILTVPDTADWTPPPDLARRLLVVNLAAIPIDEQQPPSEIDERYDRQAQKPAIRILCDATAAALGAQAESQPLGQKAWMKAAAPILNITAEEIDTALQPVRRESPIVPAIAAIVRSQPEQTWTGTPTDLMDELPPEIRPANEKVLGRRLNDAVADLAAAGIESASDRKQQARRWTFAAQAITPTKNSCHPPRNEPLPPVVWPHHEARPYPGWEEPEPAPDPDPQPEPPPEPDHEPAWDNLPPGETMPSITVKRRPEQDLQNLRELTGRLHKLNRSAAEEAALARAQLHAEIREKQAAEPKGPDDITTIDWYPAEEEDPDAEPRPQVTEPRPQGSG
ncbi:MAG TPA: hypothetical protein VGS58_01900, partial [Candidatus Sulfopaludibacter sp.]|nr:hypothetical protein [Candidatus Sulfopaludibacter sp.]